MSDMGGGPAVFVKQVKSNIKGGVCCELAPKTVIIGANERGKSAVVNAVELALSGFASRIAGRDEVSVDADLISLAPAGTDLFAGIVLSDGRQASTKIERKGSGAKKKQRECPPEFLEKNSAKAIFPLRAVTGEITGSAETARKFLVTYAVGKVTDKQIIERIPDTLHDHFKRLLAACEIHMSPLDKLMACLESSASEERGANSRAKAIDQTLNTSMQGLAPRPSEEEVKAANEEAMSAAAALAGVGAAAAMVEQAQRAQMGRGGMLSNIQALESQIAEAANRFQIAGGRLQELNAQVQRLPPGAEQPVPEHLTAMLTLLKQNAQNPANVCWCCGVQQQPGVLAQRAQQIEAMIGAQAQANAQYRQLCTDAASLQQVQQQAQQSAQAAQSSLEAMRTELARVDELIAKAAGMQSVDVNGLQLRVHNANVRVQQLNALAAQWKVIDDARNNKLAAEQEAESWKQLHGACSAAVEELLDAHVASFVAEVCKRLDPADHFFLQLRDGKRACVRIGLKQSAGEHTALSESTWARVTAALADVCADAPGGLSILVPDDRDFDPEARSRLLEALTSCRSQVIVTFAVPPTRIPAGWKVINADAGEHRAQMQTMPLQTLAPAMPAAQPASTLAPQIDTLPLHMQQQQLPLAVQQLVQQVQQPQPQQPAVMTACPACNTILVPENSARMHNGQLVHVGCPADPAYAAACASASAAAAALISPPAGAPVAEPAQSPPTKVVRRRTRKS